MSEVIELECPITGTGLDVPRKDHSVMSDVRMSAHFVKISEVTGRYFFEKFDLDVPSMVWRSEKKPADVSSWKGW